MMEDLFSNVSSKFLKCRRICGLLANKQFKMPVIMVLTLFIYSCFIWLVFVSKLFPEWVQIYNSVWNWNFFFIMFLPIVNQHILLVSIEEDPRPNWISGRCPLGNICNLIRNRRGDPEDIRRTNTTTFVVILSANLEKLNQI